MNLLFLMDFFHNTYEFFVVFFIETFNLFLYIFNKIYDFTFPYENLTPQNVSNSVSAANRIIIFILGLTVSANIYLYSTRIKKSSSIMWASRQIDLLTTNIIVNLLILFIGTLISNYSFLLNFQATNSQLKIALFIYSVLSIISIVLFLITLKKFLSGFKTDKYMKMFDLKINRRIYPINLFILIKERKQILANSKETLTLLNKKNKIQSSGYLKFVRTLNSNKAIVILKKLFIVSLTYLLFIDEFFQIISHRQNTRVVRTVSMSQKELQKIIIEIEIHCQNLNYIIEKKSDKGMEEHLSRWNSTFSKLVMLLFHVKQEDNGEIRIADVYERLLHQHSKLILATAGSYDYRNYHKTLIVSLFTGLAYKDEIYRSVSKYVFGKRAFILEDSYFKELYSLFINLMKNENFEVFELLQSDELGIRSFINSPKENEKYFQDKSRKNRFENLFLSVLIKMTELDISKNLSTVMAILLTLVEEKNKPVENTTTSILSQKKFSEIKEVNSQRNAFINLSHKNKLGLYYAAIKANEIENYRAAGYIIKILTSNLSFSSLSKVMTEVTNENLLEKNRNFYTGIHSIEFNDFSYKYCVEKTFILTNAQYYLIGDFEYTDELLSIFANMDTEYFIKKIATKQKDYNMLALDEKNLSAFKDLILKSIVETSLAQK